MLADGSDSRDELCFAGRAGSTLYNLPDLAGRPEDEANAGW